MGIEERPPWLATEAIFGSDESEHEAIRQDFAAYVDEGRGEKRRPEFSGEVSPSLSRRIRRLMGGELTLSYPILGPDSFVVEALKEQVRRHKDRSRIKGDVSVSRLIHTVFESLGLSPELACSRSRRQDVAHGRALVAWLWVERLGRPQVMVAEGLRVKSAAVSMMLRKMRTKFPSKEDEKLMQSVFETLTESADIETNTDTDNNKIEPIIGEDKGSTEPIVLVVNRNRKDMF